MKYNKRGVKISVAIALCILSAVACRTAARELSSSFASCVRGFLYIGLFSYWGISVRRRVVQEQVRRLLTAVAALMVFWVGIRTVKFILTYNLHIERYIWYLYYFPMLFIPFLSVFIAASLGKPENYRFPKKFRLFFIPITALVLFVLTNDFHFLVFSFPPEPEIWSDQAYSREFGYYLVAGCMAVCALTAVGIMIFKCRGSRNRKTIWLPPIFVSLTVIYCVLYALYIDDRSSWLFYIAGDVTVALCLLFSGTLESCLKAGLIPTNTDYDELFRTSSVGMQITDENYTVRYSSDAAFPLSREELAEAESGEYLINSETLVKAYPINGGHTVWQENVSELVKVRSELESTKEELQDRNDLLRDQYKQDAQRYRLEEQNRLYDLVQRETQKQLREIDSLSEKFDKATPDSKERKDLLLRILVLATYIKRHKDMVISADRNESLPLGLLGGALRESCSNLSLIGVGGNVYIPENGVMLSTEAALSAYEIFEEAIEMSLGTLGYFFVSVCDNDGEMRFSSNLECDADLSALSEKYPSAETERDGDGWFISYPLTSGGDKT